MVNEKTIIVVIILLMLAIGMTGCSGLGVRAEMYRIDEMKSSEQTYNKPLKCLFVDCSRIVEVNDK